MKKPYIVIRNIVTISIIMLIFACSNVGKNITIHAETDPDTDFSKYETYSWFAISEIVRDEFGQWEPPEFEVDEVVMDLISKEMNERGLTAVKEDPDLILGFAAGIDMDNWEMKKDPEKKLVTLQNIPRGALVIVIADVKSGYPVWVSIAVREGEVDSGSDAVQKRIEYAIDKMFDELPK